MSIEIELLQDALQKQAQEIAILKSIINTVPGSIYWKDKNGAYLGYNLSGAESARKFGFMWREEDTLGKTDHEIFPKEAADIFRKNDLYVMESGKEYRSEESAVLLDGKEIVQLSLKWPLRDVQGNVIGVVGNTMDITYLKKIESELLRAKEEAEAAIRIKDEFIHNVEHDIRTPFSGIWVLASYLESTETDAERKEHLKDISVCAKELLDYCNSILEFAKTEAGLLPIISKKLNLRLLISKVISMETPPAKNKNLDLSFNVDDLVPQSVIGDPQRIQRILINLVSNAIKFTDEGFVKVKVLVKEKRSRQGRIILQLIVEDTGVGIPEEKQSYIYEKFSRITPASKGIYKGSGLGLRVVKQLIEEIEGEIDVSSELNQGTIFTCTIPFKLPLIE